MCARLIGAPITGSCLRGFDFRYNTRTALGYNDLMRAEIAAAGIKGKRLTYRRPHKQDRTEA